jgi:hypothetical protein
LVKFEFEMLDTDAMNLQCILVAEVNRLKDMANEAASHSADDAAEVYTENAVYIEDLVTKIVLGSKYI